jgi:signal transduction histidine kinase
MKEAIRNQDFSFRLPTNNLLPGERAMQEALNELGENIRQQMNKNEVESWERLTRVLTHEMMNATAPITSISQSLLSRPDVKGTLLEDGIKAIYDTSRHLSDFVTNYRKMSELEKPVLSEVPLRPMLDELCKTYQQLAWTIDVPADTILKADKGMLRQILMNLIKNAIEAEATKIIIELTCTQNPSPKTILIGNDGSPIPAENRQSLFVPFFTTKRTGSGIGLSLSRRMMIQQGGMLDLAEKNLPGCHVTFVLSSI